MGINKLYSCISSISCYLYTALRNEFLRAITKEKDCCIGWFKNTIYLQNNFNGLCEKISYGCLRDFYFSLYCSVCQEFFNQFFIYISISCFFANRGIEGKLGKNTFIIQEFYKTIKHVLFQVGGIIKFLINISTAWHSYLPYEISSPPVSSRIIPST